MSPAEVPDSDDVPVQVRVLVVDDNQDAAKTLEMALELLDCEAKVAHTAVEALEVARFFRPTVVLLDIGLPDVNGYELARRLRLGPGGATMKLIATTGWGRERIASVQLTPGSTTIPPSRLISTCSAAYCPEYPGRLS